MSRHQPTPRNPGLVRFIGAPALLLTMLAAPCPAGPLCFSPTPYAVGEGPYCVAGADFNGDGFRDLALANHVPGDNRMSILINQGDGSFAPSVFYPAGPRPYWIDTGDLDGDTDIDMAVSNYFGLSISIFLNNGDGTFAPHVEYLAGQGPTFIVLARLDLDDDLDVAVGNEFDNTVSILMNNGDGTLARQAAYPVGSHPYGITAADLDNDGFIDLATGNYGDAVNPDVTVLFNLGDGTFSPTVSMPVNAPAVGIRAVDLNNDGWNDLATADLGHLADGATVSILMGLGGGAFAPFTTTATGVGAYSLDVADFNSDGLRDLVSANEEGTVSVLFGQGDGTFALPQTFPVGQLSLSTVTGDLDGNGTPEIAVACADANEVWVLFNQYAGIAQHPEGASLSEGDSITLTVVASGPPPFTYQWRKDGVDIDGATLDSLAITGATPADAGVYDVTVTNDCGPALSNPAVITVTPIVVTCAADFDNSGDVNGIDLGILLVNWATASDTTDLNDDDTTNGIDLGILLVNWGPCKE